MRTIDSDLKSKQFKHIYLLFGEEAYLVRQYKHALLAALVPEGDEMNFTRYREKEFDEASMIETANTLPFFADYRVILVEDSGCFERKCELLEDYIDHIEDTAYLIFVEDKVDKRKALYKKVQKIGDTEELKLPDEAVLKRWMGKRIRQAGLNITVSAWASFYARTGDSMDNMSNEMDKLISYCAGQEAIREEDVDAICASWVEDKIFDMIEAIAAKNPKRVMDLYRDMLLKRESPLRILILLRSQFVRLLTLKEMSRRREKDADISKATRIPQFYIGKNLNLANNFSTEDLSELLARAGDLEAEIKTGRIKEQTGLEMLMMTYAAA